MLRVQLNGARPWVFRFRREGMTLESIAPVSDNLTVKLPAVAA